MTKQQFDKAVAIVKQDAEITGAHWREGKTCVIGGLLKFAGFPVKHVAEGGILRSNYGPARECLLRHYGLDDEELRTLQRINDEIEDDITRRRVALIEKLQTFVTV